MEWLVDNWQLVVAGVAVFIIAGFYVYSFIKSPNDKKYAKVRDWLLFAVIEAEEAFGSKTGELKLRYVYNLFTIRYKWLALIVPFEKFKSMVDYALDEMRELLEENEQNKKKAEGEE